MLLFLQKVPIILQKLVTFEATTIGTVDAWSVLRTYIGT